MRGSRLRVFGVTALIFWLAVAGTARAELGACPESGAIKELIDAYVAAWTNTSDADNETEIKDFVEKYVADGYQRRFWDEWGPNLLAPATAKDDMSPKERLEALMTSLVGNTYDTDAADGAAGKGRYWKTFDPGIVKADVKCEKQADVVKYIVVPWKPSGVYGKRGFKQAKVQELKDVDVSTAFESKTRLDVAGDKVTVEYLMADPGLHTQRLKGIVAAPVNLGPTAGPPSDGTMYGKLTINNGLPPVGTGVDCIHSGGTASDPDGTDSAGWYACSGVAPGTVYLRASGQTSPACPRPMPSTGTERCDANVTGCGGSASVSMAMLLPFPLLRWRRRHQAQR